jgi:hypothetical protein
LVEHVERGQVLDLAGDGPVDEPAMRAWGDDHTISAGVIRDIVRGKLAGDPDPHGLRLRGARIHGRLDLENITSTVAIELDSCLLDEGVNAREADLTSLSLTACRVSHPTEPALDATRLTATVLHLYRFNGKASCTRGAVRLFGAHIGMLNCTGARITNDSGPALDADRLQVTGNTLLRNGFKAIGTGESAAIRLLAARLGGLDCDRATISNSSGPALDANRAQIHGSYFFRNGVATGAGEQGTIRLPGAYVSGQLDFLGARISNAAGPAVDAERVQIDGNIFLRDGVATGAGGQGAIRLVDAQVGGGLECDRAQMTNNSGPAMHAERLQVNGNIFFRNATATGTGEKGTVRLVAARLGGLECDHTTLSNSSGPAMHAERLRVDGNVFLRNGFKATGAGGKGAIRFLSAHVAGLECDRAQISNDSGPAMHAERLRVDGNVFLRTGFEATGAGKGVVLDFTGVSVGNVLYFNPAKLEHRTDPHARLRLDGLVYRGLPVGIPTGAWLALLRDGTPGYAAQPYQQLAAAHRGAGHEHEARRVLIAQRRDQINRRVLDGRFERAWARLTGLLLGYGYQPWRALIGLAAVIAIAVVLAVILGGHGALTQVRTPPSPTACTIVERIGVGLDLGTPLLTSGARTRCEATTTTTGHILTTTGWALRLLAWAFATLFIAGFTSAVRKT